jgi:hypothetical protein
MTAKQTTSAAQLQSAALRGFWTPERKAELKVAAEELVGQGVDKQTAYGQAMRTVFTTEARNEVRTAMGVKPVAEKPVQEELPLNAE